MSLSIIVMFRIHPFANDANWEGLERPGPMVQIDHHQPATSNNMGVSKNGHPGYPPKMYGLSWENPIKMDDLFFFKTPLFSETSTSTERCCLTFIFWGAGGKCGIQASLSQVLHQYLDGPSPRFGDAVVIYVRNARQRMSQRGHEANKIICIHVMYIPRDPNIS